MKRFMIVLLLIGMTPVAYSRLGETKEQCDARYGKGTQRLQLTPGADVSVLYFKEGFAVYAEFITNQCVAITYHRSYPYLTQTEVTTFFNANGGITKWANYSGGESNMFVGSGDGALATTNKQVMSFYLKNWPSITGKATEAALKKQEEENKKRLQKTF